MIIKGIEHNAYYLHNPIWVDVDNLNAKLYLAVSIQGKAYSFPMLPRNGSVRFDLAKIILGLIGVVENKERIALSGATADWIVDGAYSAKLTFKEGSSAEGVPNSISLNKTFVLGGEVGYASNLPVGNTLSLGNATWEGYPYFDFKLINGSIQGKQLHDTNRRVRVKCNNAYLLFRNLLGGFSGYLFEDHNTLVASTSRGEYFTDNNIVAGATNANAIITLRTKLKREDYKLMEHLAVSNEVYLFKGWEEQGELVRLIGGNRIDINYKKNVIDHEVSFGIPANYSEV